MSKAKINKPLKFDAGKYAEVFAKDMKQFGREVAIYNLGWLRGDDNGYRRAKKGK